MHCMLGKKTSNTVKLKGHFDYSCFARCDRSKVWEVKNFGEKTILECWKVSTCVLSTANKWSVGCKLSVKQIWWARSPLIGSWMSLKILTLAYRIRRHFRKIWIINQFLNWNLKILLGNMFTDKIWEILRRCKAFHLSVFFPRTVSWYVWRFFFEGAPCRLCSFPLRQAQEE